LIAFAIPFVLPGLGESYPDKKPLCMNLQECIARAVEVSPELDAEESRLGEARSQYNGAVGSRYLPQLDLLNVSSVAPALNVVDNDLANKDTRNDWNNIGFFNNLQLTLVQPLYTFGKIKNTIEASRLGVEAQEKNVVQKRNEIIFRIARLYFSKLLADELISVTEEGMKIANKAENVLNDMLKDEDIVYINEADLYRVRLLKFEIQRLNREVIGKRKLALTTLTTLLDYSEDDHLELVDKYLECLDYQILSLEHYQRLKDQFRPEISRLNAAVDAQKALKQISLSALYPQIFIAGNAVLAFAPSRDNIKNPLLNDPWNRAIFRAAVGVRMSLNIHQIKAQVKKEEYALQRAKAIRSAVFSAIEQEVVQAFSALLEARDNYDDAKEAFKLSREWLRTEEITFDLDASNAKDLADAIEKNLTAKTTYYKSIYDFNMAITQLMLSTGHFDWDR
jgi:outer membrane protein TolC